MLQLKRVYEPKSPADGQRELSEQKDVVDRLARLARRRRVTLVFGARDEAHNDAVVLAAVVRRRMACAVPRKRAANNK